MYSNFWAFEGILSITFLALRLIYVKSSISFILDNVKCSEHGIRIIFSSQQLLNYELLLENCTY